MSPTPYSVIVDGSGKSRRLFTKSQHSAGNADILNASRRSANHAGICLRDRDRIRAGGGLGRAATAGGLSPRQGDPAPAARRASRRPQPYVTLCGPSLVPAITEARVTWSPE